MEAFGEFVADGLFDDAVTGEGDEGLSEVERGDAVLLRNPFQIGFLLRRLRGEEHEEQHHKKWYDRAKRRHQFQDKFSVHGQSLALSSHLTHLHPR